MSEIFSKILKDKNGKVLNVGSKCKQPDWGVEEGCVNLPETTVEFADGQGMIVTALTQWVEVGNTYDVAWNGTTYECIGQLNDIDGTAFVLLGNGEMMGAAGNGEPFMIMIVPESNYAQMGASAMVMALDGSTTATLSISGDAYHRIPASYLDKALQNSNKAHMFYVNNDGNWYANEGQTVQSVYDAINAGKTVYLNYNGRIFPLTQTFTTSDSGSAIYFSGTYVNSNTNEAVTHYFSVAGTDSITVTHWETKTTVTLNDNAI